MKNQILKMKKSEGYIGIETMIIAGLVIAAGFVALTSVMGDLKLSADGINTDLKAATPGSFAV